MKKIFKTMFLCLVAVFAVNANAISSSDKFDGEYSIDYLLRHYDVVTLGMNSVYDINNLSNYITPGEVRGVSEINGSVLINGKIKGNTNIGRNFYNAYPGPSYIKKITSEVTIGYADAYVRNDYYLGTGSTSYNNPNNLSVAETDDYIDFEKLYYSILNQQSEMRADADNQGGFDSSTDREYWYRQLYYSEGNHVYDNGAVEFLIGNDIFHVWDMNIYIDKNNSSYVIINIDDVVVDGLPYVYVNDSNYNNTNVIFNFPNARYIKIETWNNRPYHIVAPKADIEFSGGGDHYGTIIANSIYYSNDDDLNIRSQHLTYSSGLYNSDISDAKFGIQDTNEDLYMGDYSIDELLRNYNLVVFGKNTTTAADVYHIVGNFLINGNLGKNGKVYSPISNYYSMTEIAPYPYNPLENYTYTAEYDGGDFSYHYTPEFYRDLGIRLDLNSKNAKYGSYITGDVYNKAYVTDSLHERQIYYYNRYGSDFTLPDYYPSNLYLTNNFDLAQVDYVYALTATGDNGVILIPEQSTYITNNYIDFDYLYNNITEKQALIKQGDKLTKNSSNEIVVETGGYYNIDSVADVSKIVFNNFRNNRNNITVITINQEGEVVMPYQETDYADNMYTNDFYGKNKPLYYDDEIYNEFYYGNVVFNFPNATKVTFAEDNSFKGHIIAPKAAIEMPEMNLAGCVIADSVSSQGYTELHYYPLALGDIVYEDPTPDPEPESELGAYAEIKGTLIWADEDDKDAIRPAYVVVHFYADGVKIATKKVYEADNWQFSLEVPIDKEGKVTYTIDNDDVSGYVFDYNETSKYNYEITVSHKIKGVKAEVENPKTGAFNIILLFIPLIVLIGGYIYLSKKTTFKNI